MGNFLRRLALPRSVKHGSLTTLHANSARDSLRWLMREALKIEGKARRAAVLWAIGSESKSRLDAALALAATELPIADAGEGWDADPWLLGVANGVLDLRTGELRDGRREDRITRHSDVEFNAAASCPRWEKFLSEIFSGDAALVEFIRRAVGLTLTGSQREQVFFILVGRGANGKGVLLETLRYVLGPYAFDAGFSTFEDKGRMPTHPEAEAELAGRRMVTASEVREKTKLAEQRLKALSHGDTTSAAFKYGRRFEFKPECKIWLGLNHKPTIQDDSYGFWRSVRLVPFRRQFVDDADDALTDKLRAEAPGILAWAVEGCLAWQADGLAEPKTVTAASKAYRAESDPLAEFLEECCIVDEDVEVRFSDLYFAYQHWADGERLKAHDQLTRTALGSRLGERFARDRDAGKKRIYVGVTLKTEHRPI